MSHQSDATHAYRGYRQQALYILSRILEDTHSHTFQPEGLEDLAVFDSRGVLVEVAQVKSYSENLTLSDFAPKQPTGFFSRVRDYLLDTPSASIHIISFGNFGDSFYKALSTDGHQRNEHSEKLHGYGYLTIQESALLLSTIQPIQVDEQKLYDSIQSQLKSSFVGEPNHSFDLLSFWIYRCSEQKTKITRQDVIDKIAKVGKFINERAAHHREWFTSIKPLEDQDIDDDRRSELKVRFYEGVSARYEHILAHLDVARPQKLQQIHAAFEHSRVVIIHGVSGQGKTTLALRYMHDYLPDQWRFYVHSPESRAHALSIATAIAGHARDMNIPMVIYLDVRPSDTYWTDVVRELASLPNIRILVTIREDDLRRASFSNIDFQYTTVELHLDRDEAQNIFAQLTETKLPSNLINFEAAWAKFSVADHGPLMEFVYLVTQGTSLTDRLTQQITALQDEVIRGKLDGHILQLLRLVAIASAYGSRLNRQLLVHSQNAPGRLFERLKKEYLVKPDSDEFLVEGVHPLRSQIIKGLLVDEYVNWQEDIRVCLNCMDERNVGNFLLELFVNEPKRVDDTVAVLQKYQPHAWAGLSGVTRSLIWLGVRQFVKMNAHVLDEAYAHLGNSGMMMLDPDIAGAMPGSGKLLDGLADSFPEVAKKSQELRAQLQGLDSLFRLASIWLQNLNATPTIPKSVEDWRNLAEGVFWLYRLQINQPINSWLASIDFRAPIHDLPLNVLADMGAAFAQSQGTLQWSQESRQLLLSRFKEETQTVHIETTKEGVKLHYIFNIEDNDRSPKSTDPIHYESLYRVQLYADLFSEPEIIEIQAHGHRIVDLGRFDSSYKRINRHNLARK